MKTRNLVIAGLIVGLIHLSACGESSNDIGILDSELVLLLKRASIIKPNRNGMTK